MAQEICIPRLGWSMEEGVFVGWLKKDGDAVAAGEPLFEMEGEKGLQEVEAVDAGILRIPPTCPKAGTTLLVGTLLGYLVEANAAAPWEQTPTAPEPVTAIVATAVPTPQPEQAEEISSVDSSPETATQPTNGQRIASTPRARRVAEELGVDWQQAAGTGAGLRVREVDIRQLAAATNVQIQMPQQGAAESGSYNDIAPLSPRRRTIAQRMLASHTQTAPVTLTTRTAATGLVALRNQFKSAGGAVPSYTDIIAKLAALVLRLHPKLAATWVEGGLKPAAADGFDISIAVDTEEGLVVPVLRDVARRSLVDLTQDSQRLITQARSGRLSSTDMQGGVFTITNLGAFGIDAFTPIISSPQVAILGLGAIRREAVVQDDDQIVACEMMSLSLTFDHRALDGAPAAKFLQTLCKAISNPPAWLMGIEGQQAQATS